MKVVLVVLYLMEGGEEGVGGGGEGGEDVGGEEGVVVGEEELGG